MIRELEQRIRDLAHRIWEREGRPADRAQSHWEMAATEIADEDAKSSAAEPKPAKAARAPRTPKPAAAAKATTPRVAKTAKTADEGKAAKAPKAAAKPRKAPQE